MIDTSLTLFGNVTDEPRMRGDRHGQPFTTFSVACNERLRDPESGRWSNGGTSYFEVITFRDLAVHCATSLHKGTPVVVTGQLKMEQWTNDQQMTRTTASVTAEQVAISLRWGGATYQRDTATGGENASEEAAHDGGENGAQDGAEATADPAEGTSIEDTYELAEGAV